MAEKKQGFQAARAADPVVASAALTPPVISQMFNDDRAAQEALDYTGRIGKRADVAAVIVAGGKGERFGLRNGKQLLKIYGKPVLTWAIQAFDACEQVGRIVVVCPADRMEEYRALAIEPYPFVTPITLAPAGVFRQESAMNGLEAVPGEFKFVAMHDGARPLVTKETISHAINILRGTADADGVVCGFSAIDTLKVVDGLTIVGTPERSMFWIAQTPQIFYADVLRSAHEAAMTEGYVGTDDSSLVERIGGRVILVNSPRDNIKVTVPEDLGPVTAALERRLIESEIDFNY